MVLCQTKIRFHGHDIYQGTIKPNMKSLAFADKFPDEIKDKKQLQRFLGYLNYICIFFPNLRLLCAPLYRRLRKNPIPWSNMHTHIVRQIKEKVKSLPCLNIPNLSEFMIVKTDVSDIGYGGILKHKLESQEHEQLVRFHSGLWLGPQQNYYTIKKEILSVVLCVSKFQDDLLYKKFLISIDCKSPKKFFKRVLGI